MTPRTHGGLTLVAPATVPEPGAWFLTDQRHGELPILARLPRDDDGHEDPEALELAWERLRHLEHLSIPEAVAFKRDDAMVLVGAPLGVPLIRLVEQRQEPAFQMTPGTVLALGTALADALVHAHERGRPHGHLSPEEIWVTPEGQLVIWGFGIGPDQAGAARWWSPERARGRRSSGDADQWALGAILAALVTGRLPWRSDDPVTEARVGDTTHLSGPVLEQWKPLGRILQRALASEPRDRFPSVHPMRHALDAMRQRVEQGSDLATMGAELWRREAPEWAKPVDPSDVPEPAAASRKAAVVVDPAAPAMPPPMKKAEDLPTPTIVAADGDAPTSALEVGLDQRFVPNADDFDEPTHAITNPTRVPNEDEDLEDDGDEATDVDPGGAPVREAVVSVDDEVMLASLPVETVPVVDAATMPPTVDGPPSLGDVAIAEREPVPQVGPPASVGPVDIRRVAPWVVGTMVVLVLIYGAWGVLG